VGERNVVIGMMSSVIESFRNSKMDEICSSE
jgi:hypothetical protein